MWKMEVVIKKMFPFVNLYIWTIRCACHNSYCFQLLHFFPRLLYNVVCHPDMPGVSCYNQELGGFLSVLLCIPGSHCGGHSIASLLLVGSLAATLWCFAEDRKLARLGCVARLAVAWFIRKTTEGHLLGDFWKPNNKILVQSYISLSKHSVCTERIHT